MTMTDAYAYIHLREAVAEVVITFVLYGAILLLFYPWPLSYLSQCPGTFLILLFFTMETFM